MVCLSEGCGQASQTWPRLSWSSEDCPPFPMEAVRTRYPAESGGHVNATSTDDKVDLLVVGCTGEIARCTPLSEHAAQQFRVN